MANWKIVKVQGYQVGGVRVISEWTCLMGGRWSILLRNMRRLGCSLVGEWAVVVSLSSCLWYFFGAGIGVACPCLRFCC